MSDLAKKLGVTRPRVNAILRSPSIKEGTWDRISTALGMTMGDWVDPLEPMG